MDRRKFLKACLKAGIALPTIQLASKAWGWGSLPMIVGSGGSWSTWDGKKESGWGDPTVFILIADGGDSANEIGQNGNLSEADRTFTQNGAIATAVDDGGYYYRPMDGANDYFTTTYPWFNSLCGKDQWFLGVKCYLNPPDNNPYYIYDWENAVNVGRLSALTNAGNLTLGVRVDGVKTFTEQNITSLGNVEDKTGWLCFWTDANKTSAGWKTGNSQPTRRADFDYTVDWVERYFNMVALGGITHASVFSLSGASYMAGRLYAIVMVGGKSLIT